MEGTLAMETGAGRTGSRDSGQANAARLGSVSTATSVTLLLSAFAVGSATVGRWSPIATARAQSLGAVTRGPYLQMGTPQSIVVRWRTDVDTDSRVIFGLLSGPMNRTAGSVTRT